ARRGAAIGTSCNATTAAIATSAAGSRHQSGLTGRMTASSSDPISAQPMMSGQYPHGYTAPNDSAPHATITTVAAARAPVERLRVADRLGGLSRIATAGITNVRRVLGWRQPRYGLQRRRDPRRP